MNASVVSATACAPRVSTGIAGLDALIGGGFPSHRTVLVSGDIGTGKTTLGLQFLMEGARRGEPGVLVCVDDKPQHLVEDGRAFGWDLEAAADRELVTVLHASPCFTALRSQSGLEARQVASDLTRYVRRVQAARLVIDAATSLVPDGTPLDAVEDFLRSLIAAFDDNLGCTTVLAARNTTGPGPSMFGPIAERLTAGVVELRVGQLAGPSGRSVLVRKMRGTPTALAARSFDIVDGRGIVVREA